MSDSNAKIPLHVAIIMDGNGRWAKSRGLARLDGHRKGVENVRTVLEASRDWGIRYLTLYAFSVENWKRPKKEVDTLMDLLVRFLNREKKQLIKNGIRLRSIGREQELPEKVRIALKDVCDSTRHFEDNQLILALNYGSRTELLDAVQQYGEALQQGKEQPGPLQWSDFQKYLYTKEIPDPDLIIRTSGENRLSNFLLMQAAYAEMYFSPVCWPEFKRDDFAQAIQSYQSRERRFGLTGEQIQQSSTS
jgi:undecaprenyl diphosphate synthase